MAGGSAAVAHRDPARAEVCRFVLLHDLTSCLTIGDATSFKEIGNDYEAYLYEIESDPNRTVSQQLRRQWMAEEEIRSVLRSWRRLLR